MKKVFRAVVEAAGDLSEEARPDIERRLNSARALICSTDALERLQKWKYPEEL